MSHADDALAVWELVSLGLLFAQWLVSMRKPRPHGEFLWTSSVDLYR